MNQQLLDPTLTNNRETGLKDVRWLFGNQGLEEQPGERARPPLSAPGQTRGTDRRDVSWTLRCIPSFPPLRLNFAEGNPGWLCNLWIHGNTCSGLTPAGISSRFKACSRAVAEAPCPEPLRISPGKHRVLPSSGQNQQHAALPLTGKRPRTAPDTRRTQTSPSPADLKPSLVF